MPSARNHTGSRRPRPNIAVRPGDAPDLEAALAERIYEFNAAATGYHDGESFSAALHDAAGTLEAGATGYTWGGCCYVAYLWVTGALRRQGTGTALMEAIERHARDKGCRVVFLATHSFQAPEFYERRGYRKLATVTDHPVGYASFHYAKALAPV